MISRFPETDPINRNSPCGDAGFSAFLPVMRQMCCGLPGSSDPAGE